MGICITKQKKKSTLSVKSSPTLTTPHHVGDEIIVEKAKSLTCFTKTQMKGDNLNSFKRERNESKVFVKSFLAKSYSVLNTNKLVYDQRKQRIVQHNLTGQIRTAMTIEKEDENVEEIENLIEKIAQNSNISPYFANVKDIFQDNKAYYLIREYCSGEIIDNLSGKVTEEEIALLLSQIFEVMEKIHKLGKYHGSLTINSFQLLDNSKNFYIKLIDIVPVYQNISKKQEILEKQILDLKAIAMILYKLIFNKPINYQTTDLLLQQKRDFINKGGLYSIIIKLITATNLNIYQEFKCQDYFNKIIKQQYGKLFTKKMEIKIDITYSQQRIILLMHELFYQERFQELETIFEMIDQKGNGTLGANEIIKELDLESKENTLSNIEGMINKQELILYQCDKLKLLTDFNLNITFSYLTKKPYITASNISNLIESDQEQINQNFIAFCGSKRLLKEQFFEMMQNLLAS